jgi:hypothetical protein
MVQFHLSHSDTKYFYPETAADITLEQYVYFHKFILPQYPEVELDALIAQKQMNAAYEKIKPYAKKLGIDLKTTPTDVVKECEIILLTKDVKDNVRRFLPALIDQFNASQSKLVECFEIMDEVWEANVKYPYMAKVVNYFTGIPLNACYGKVAESLELKYLTFMFTKILNAISVPEELKYKQIYDFNGTLYYLPDKLMAKSTLLEFAEAAQFDKGRKAIANNDAQGLLHVIAVLLRKKDEAYSDEVFQRNCIDFLKLPLQVGFEIGFFLTKLSESYTTDLQTSMLKKAMESMPPLQSN